MKYAVVSEEPQTVAIFKLEDGRWAITQNNCPKTAWAIAFWAWGEKMPRPEWVEFDRPKTIGDRTRIEGNEAWVDDYSGRPTKPYARTEATVQFVGEATPRKLRVTFTWQFSITGEGQPNLPEANGGYWVVEEITQ